MGVIVTVKDFALMIIHTTGFRTEGGGGALGSLPPPPTPPARISRNLENYDDIIVILIPTFNDKV